MHPLHVINIPESQRSIRHDRATLPRHYAVNLEGSVLIKDPPLLTSDVIGRADVSPYLRVGDSAVLDECSLNEGLPTLDRERY